MRRLPSSSPLLLVLTLLAVATLVMTGCGDDAENEAANETTLPPGPPCFGLVQVYNVPDWAGGLALGERHDVGDSVFDLTATVGCAIDQGMVVVRGGSVASAFVDDCDGFDSDDIPPQELRPPADRHWGCLQDIGTDDDAPAWVVFPQRG
jgi:hypothetical protein